MPQAVAGSRPVAPLSGARRYPRSATMRENRRSVTRPAENWQSRPPRALSRAQRTPESFRARSCKWRQRRSPSRPSPNAAPARRSALSVLPGALRHLLELERFLIVQRKVDLRRTRRHGYRLLSALHGGRNGDLRGGSERIRVFAGELPHALDDGVQALRLRGQLLACRRALLRVRGIALRYPLHLPDGGDDLLDPARLLLTAGVDLVHQRLHLRRAAGDLPDRARHLLELSAAFLRTRNRFFDQCGSVLRRLGAAMSQIADLIGDYREAHPGITGARRFHRGVQGQNVRLERNLVDHPDDL